MVNTANSELSITELEALLAKRKKEVKAKKEQERKTYIEERDRIMIELYEEAKEHALALARFKQKAHAVMDAQKTKLDGYGGIRSSSKGGFTIVHSNADLAITRRRDTDPVWDERAQKAVALLKDFIADTVKKRDADLHDILLGFLERNTKGDLEYAKVMELVKHEDKFDDQRWLEGLRLIKESYTQGFKAFGYEFKTKDKNGKWQSLTLNFSSL